MSNPHLSLVGTSIVGGDFAYMDDRELSIRMAIAARDLLRSMPASAGARQDCDARDALSDLAGYAYRIHDIGEAERAARIGSVSDG